MCFSSLPMMLLVELAASEITPSSSRLGFLPLTRSGAAARLAEKLYALLYNALRAIGTKPTECLKLLTLYLVIGDEKVLDLINNVAIQIAKFMNLTMVARVSGNSDKSVIATCLFIFRLISFNHSE